MSTMNRRSGGDLRQRGGDLLNVLPENKYLVKINFDTNSTTAPLFQFHSVVEVVIACRTPLI